MWVSKMCLVGVEKAQHRRQKKAIPVWFFLKMPGVLVRVVADALREGGLHGFTVGVEEGHGGLLVTLTEALDRKVDASLIRTIGLLTEHEMLPLVVEVEVVGLGRKGRIVLLRVEVPELDDLLHLLLQTGDLEDGGTMGRFVGVDLASDGPVGVEDVQVVGGRLCGSLNACVGQLEALFAPHLGADEVDSRALLDVLCEQANVVGTILAVLGEPASGKAVVAELSHGVVDDPNALGSLAKHIEVCSRVRHFCG